MGTLFNPWTIMLIACTAIICFTILIAYITDIVKYWYDRKIAQKANKYYDAISYIRRLAEEEKLTRTDINLIIKQMCI